MSAKCPIELLMTNASAHYYESLGYKRKIGEGIETIALY
jgi:hypothetical protein